MLLLVPLGALILASTSAALVPHQISEYDRAVVALDILKRAEEEGRDVLPIVRQLLGGGSAFAPYQVSCPTGFTWVRPADSLGVGEQAFLQQRRPKVQEGYEKMMAGLGMSLPPRTPTIAFALSGGGYRAMQIGLGGVMGTMNKSSEAAASGTGGWIDAVTYMAGLSGGSWGTGTFIANGGQLPTDLITNLWDLESNLIVPADDKLSFYYDMISNVDAKSSAGFPTQITDYWGLALGDHLLPTPFRLDTSPNFTISNLTNYVPSLSSGDLPMPIIIAAEREPGETVVPANATVWEFTPYEFGAWAFGADTKTTGAFTPVEYLGTRMNNGQVNGSCYKGFDQLSFVMGTSSTLFNAGLTMLTAANASGVIVDALQDILKGIGEDDNDISQIPNSFHGYNDGTNPISNFTTITLVDAGETNQNLPIEPLLIPSRNVDAILAFDSSADTTYSWPNGSALYTTYDRSLALAAQQNVSIRMPPVPSTNGFVNGGLNTRPVFFGCNQTDTPIIVYVPNYPWSTAANFSTFKLDYTQDESTAAVLNGMRSLTLNGSVPTWPKCLACALSDRAFDYTSSNRSSECQACFNTWCWNGIDDSTAPSANYTPQINSIPTFLSQNNLVQQGSAAAPSSGTPSSASAAVSPSSTQSASSGAKSSSAGFSMSSAALLLTSIFIGAVALI